MTELSPSAPVCEYELDIIEVNSTAHGESDNAAYSAATNKILSRDCNLYSVIEAGILIFGAI